jgi:tripartite-type tricarboxylate transporter receptor subunit TctC
MNCTSNRTWMRVVAVLLGMGLLLAGFGQEVAESKSATAATAKEDVKWPTKPVTILVGMSAGGSTDVVARAFQPYFQKELGQNIIVVNVEGAGGNIGLTQLSKAKPDGYSMAIYAFPSACLNELAKGGNFKIREFSYIEGIVGGDTNSIYVKSDSPVKDLKNLIEMTKTKKVTMSGSGIGTNSHMALSYCRKPPALPLNMCPLTAVTRAPWPWPAATPWPGSAT